MLMPNPDDPGGLPVRVPIQAGQPQWQKTTEPSEHERKVQYWVGRGYSEDMARDIVAGRIRPVTDPNTGIHTTINTRPGVGGGRSHGGAPGVDDGQIGTAAAAAAAGGGIPLTNDQRGAHLDFLAKHDEFKPLLADAKRAAEIGLGVTGVLGEYSDRVLGQLPESVRDEQLFGRRVGDLFGDTSGARADLAIARQRFIDLLRSDGRVLKDEYKDIANIWPSDGMFESPERAADVLSRVERYLNEREGHVQQRLGGGAQEGPRSSLPAQDRPVGMMITTDRGTFKWTGTGWLPAN
jgi:hypothetical protein